MEIILLVVHVLAGASVIGLVLLQQGKGADAGASFGGGASQTLFGSAGAGSFLGKLTAALSVLFFCTSLGLAVVAKNKAISVGNYGLPIIPTESSDVPQIDSSLPKTVD